MLCLFCFTGCCCCCCCCFCCCCCCGKLRPRDEDYPDFPFDDEEETPLNKDRAESYDGTASSDHPSATDADSSTPIVLGYGGENNEPDIVITAQPTSSS